MQVLDVLLGQRRRRQRDPGRVDALVLAERSAVDDDLSSSAVGSSDDLAARSARRRAADDRPAAPIGPARRRAVKIAARLARRVACGDDAASSPSSAAAGSPASGPVRIFGPLRSCMIATCRPACAATLADAREGLGMRLVRAVREVEPEDIDARGRRAPRARRGLPLAGPTVAMILVWRIVVVSRSRLAARGSQFAAAAAHGPTVAANSQARAASREPRAVTPTDRPAPSSSASPRRRRAPRSARPAGSVRAPIARHGTSRMLSQDRERLEEVPGLAPPAAADLEVLAIDVLMRVDGARTDVGVVAGDDVAAAVARRASRPPRSRAPSLPPRSRRRRLRRGSGRGPPPAAPRRSSSQARTPRRRPSVARASDGRRDRRWRRPSRRRRAAQRNRAQPDRADTLDEHGVAAAERGALEDVHGREQPAAAADVVSSVDRVRQAGNADAGLEVDVLRPATEQPLASPSR